MNNSELLNLRKKVLDNLKKNNLSVFPLRDKRPAVSNWKNYSGEVNDAQAFGVVLGKESKIFVIDVDDYSLESEFKHLIEKTYSVRSGKGFHIYCKTNNLPKNLRLNNPDNQHIDIQSTGTYVVGETSKHYEKNADGKYVESGKTYELISKSREINFFDYETEVKSILERLKFNLEKKPIKEELSDAIKKGVPKGNRNNTLFKLACHIYKTTEDEEITRSTILFVNERFQEPFPERGLLESINSAFNRVKDEVSNNSNTFKIDDNTEYQILDTPPKRFNAITLDEDNTRLILVYLPTRIQQKNSEFNASKAYVVSNGIQGKQIRACDDKELHRKYNIKLSSEFFPLENRWKYTNIVQYVDSDEKVDPLDVFNNMHNLERKYFEYENEYDYYYQACWVAHTYFYTFFTLTPYNDHSGMKNVGKSKHLKLLKYLCYNGISSGDSSISSLFRTIQGTGATFLLDETENLKGGKEDRTDLEKLLRSGFSKEGIVSRSKKGKNEEYHPEFFSVYCPKALGHIQGLDNVLEDRCIKTRLRRTTNKSIADTDPDEEEDPLIYQTRESLYRLFLDHGDEIHDLIPDAKKLIQGLSGREMKLWLPIMTMALFFQNHGVSHLVEKIQAKMHDASEDKKISDMEDNIDYKILQILDSLTTIPNKSRELYDAINENLYNHWRVDFLGDAKIKQSLERLGFRNKRESQGVMWTITPEMIKESKEKLGLSEPTQATLSESISA